MSGRIFSHAALRGAMLIAALFAGPVAAEEVAWRTDWRAAWEEAQEQQRPLLVFVTRDHCKFCTKMKQSTYVDEQIVKRVEQGFVPVAIDSVLEEKFARDLKVAAYPTTVLISPDSKILDRIKGFVEPKEFNARLADAERRLESIARRKPAGDGKATTTK